MNIKKIVNLTILGCLVLPLVVGAATPSMPDIKGTHDVFTILDNVRNILWAFLAVVVIIMFVWAGIIFVTAEGDPGKVERARSRVLYGIIGLIVAALAGGVFFIVTQLMKP